MIEGSLNINLLMITKFTISILKFFLKTLKSSSILAADKLI